MSQTPHPDGRFTPADANAQVWVDGGPCAGAAPWAPPQGRPAPPAGYAQPPALAAAAAGSLYHEQARNGRQGALGRLGEVLLVTVLLAAGLIAVTVAGMAIGHALGLQLAPDGGDRVLSDPLADEAMGLVGLAVGIPVVLLAVRACGRRPAGTVISVLGRLRWGWLARCAAVAFPLIALQMGALVLWGRVEDGPESLAGEFPGWLPLLLGSAVFLGLVPFQAAAEEFVFRGWLVQFFGGFLRSPWPGIVVASLLFALAHGFGAWSGFALLFYSAVWWGWLVIRTGGLEAVIAIHTANNVLSYGIALALGQLADSGTAADAPWQALVLELVCAPAYCLLISRLGARYGVESRSPDHQLTLPVRDAVRPAASSWPAGTPPR
ncbi:type II CAAX endopeptidase family protein [Streptomyces katrae]|uniref:type II CAAX endopeptidase family protein n=1 Tax=Streptomyces katrae TaxID=68223 RepID=UPI0007C44999|nr:type II CAAX endopeptidase family protein [Streptomyces katrae]